MSGFKYIARISIGSVASTASFSIALVLMENGLNSDLLPYMNPLDWF